MSGNTTNKNQGTIELGVLYPIEEFKRRTGFGSHAMRTARRNGLKVRYVGGRAFVRGDDFLSYIDKLDADEQS
jgi:hypothetical protein